jgi:propionate CoA-transferase
MNKYITTDQFQEQIKTVKSMAVTGFRWSGTPQLLLRLVREEFDKSGEPNGLTIMFTSSATDPGLDHLAHPDLLACSFGSYYGSIPEIRKLVQDNKIKGYSLPQGQLSLLFREIGRGSPGLLSTVGINTFVDPRLDGGKLNAKTDDDVVTIESINGKEFLFYHSRPVDAALIRGTIADAKGNVSMRHEPVKTEFLSMAQAARSSGGQIFVQVSETSETFLQPHEIDLPGHLVDGVIVTCDLENDHRHTNKYTFHEGLLKNGNYSKEAGPVTDPIYKQLIGLRALKEVQSSKNVILGQGVPELVGVFAQKNSEKYGQMLTFMESGVMGGTPERRPDFGVAFDPVAFLTQDNQFVGFNGGHMDMAVLSFVQFDEKGNINVSVLGDDYFGCGGYIDICHGAKKIVFVGSFTAKGLDVINDSNGIKIKNEGTIKKAVKSVDEITYSPKMQKESGQEIRIITERCVFSIENNKVTLIEIANGVDLKKDILDQMDFRPQISENLRL